MTGEFSDPVKFLLQNGNAEKIAETVTEHSERINAAGIGNYIRVGRGLDPSMDWIGLDLLTTF